jgi:hypothetical protein
VSKIVIAAIEQMRELTVVDVDWVGPELGLGIYVDVDAEDAPLLDEARRRMTLTTTASGAIG